MRLLTRFAAAAVTVAAFTVPATLPAAHAVQVPAPTGAVVHTTPGTFNVSQVTLKAGTLVTIVNTTPDNFRYEITPSGSTTTIASGGVGTLPVGEVEQMPNLNRTPNYRLQAFKTGSTSPSATLDIVAL